MSDQAAHEMGLRWLAAGFKPTRGCKDVEGHMLLAKVYRPGLAMDVWHIVVGRSIVYEFVPDPRDPGNKGHAVAQLRWRRKDQTLYVARDFVDGNESVHEGWTVVHNALSHEDPTGFLTEEDAITADLEATAP